MRWNITWIFCLSYRKGCSSRWVSWKRVPLVTWRDPNQSQGLGPGIRPGPQTSLSSLRCEGSEVGAGTPNLWPCLWIHTREHLPLLFGETASPSLWGAAVSLILDVLHFQSRDLKS